jgi:hypothetical protein
MTPSRVFFDFSEELKKDVTFMFNYIDFIGKIYNRTSLHFNDFSI